MHSSDLDVESFLSLLLCYRADAPADPNPEISLIDESSALCEDSDAGLRVVALQARAGQCLIALLPTRNGRRLLTADATSAAAYVITLRARFGRDPIGSLASAFHG